jgi:urease accessory protein
LSASVRVCAEVGASGATVITALSGTEPWRPRIVVGRGAPGWGRVALVQSRASLLAGDDVELVLDVGDGASLEVVELGAVLAHHARGVAPACVVARVSVAAGGRLIWLGQPLIVGAGARVRSSVAMSLEAGAVALRGEAVVLGRAGEACGALWARMRICVAGVPAVDETLDTGDPALRSALVAGDATMIAAVTLAGMRDTAPPSGGMQAHGAATLWRDAGATVEVGAAAAAVADRWRRLLEIAAYGLGGAPSAAPDGAGRRTEPFASASSGAQFSAMLPRTESKIVNP